MVLSLSLMEVVPLVLKVVLLMLLMGVFIEEELDTICGYRFETQMTEDLMDPFLSMMNVFLRLKVTEKGVSSKV